MTTKNKTKNPTRAEAMAWPAEALAAARVRSHEGRVIGEPDAAWRWLRTGEADALVQADESLGADEILSGVRPTVEVYSSSRTDGEWVRVYADRKERDEALSREIPTDPKRLVSWLVEREVTGGLEPDHRRVMRESRMNLQAAVLSGDAQRIARRRDEAVEVARMWEDR